MGPNGFKMVGRPTRSSHETKSNRDDTRMETNSPRSAATPKGKDKVGTEDHVDPTNLVSISRAGN